MKIEFTWSHLPEFWKKAKDVANSLNEKEKRTRWEGRSYSTGGYVYETLSIKVNTLRGANLYYLQRMVEANLSIKPIVWIDGRTILGYAIWADDQLRKLLKQRSMMEMGLRYARVGK